MIQDSLLMLWMDENACQQSNKKMQTKENLLLLGKQQPNWLKLLLHGE